MFYLFGQFVADENMFVVIFDLLLAGSETTSTSLHWGLLYMIRNPDVQTKCRQEILQVGANSCKINNSILYSKYCPCKGINECVNELLYYRNKHYLCKGSCVI